MTVAALVNGEMIADAAEACVVSLPAENGWSMAPFSAGAAPEPGAGAIAVAAPLGDVGRLVLAVSSGLGRAVQAGSPPADDLLAALRPALTSAAAALTRAFGFEAPLAPPIETAASGALQPAPGEMVTAAVLLDGDTHVATLALITPAPAAAALAAEAMFPSSHEFPVLPGEGGRAAGRGGPIELLSEVEMGVTVELGRTRMLVREILELSPGSVIELDRAAGSPIDVLVNGTLIARGEVVVIDEEFGIRITEVIGYDEGKQPR